MLIGKWLSMFRRDLSLTSSGCPRIMYVTYMVEVVELSREGRSIIRGYDHRESSCILVQ